MSVNSKDAFYFPHDSNAKDDPKCSLLIEQLGLEGYGAFWVLVETLRDQPNYSYPMSLLPVIARKYNTTHDKLRAVVETYGLFKCEEGIFFYSPSLKHRMEKIDNRRKILAESGRRGGLKASKAKARLELPLSNCSSDPQAVKESKVKESKVKENKKNTDPDKLGSDVFCKQVTEYYILKFTEKYGTKPALNFSKDYMVVKNTKNLFKNESEWKNLIDYFLDSEKAGKFGATLSICFSSNTINQFKQLKAEPCIPKG